MYNDAERLRVCLESIKALALPSFEVIVVDNNCTDESASVARKYPFVRIIRENKQGIVFARDAGFDAARGQYIIRFDADTVVTQHWADELERVVARHRALELWASTGPGTFYNAKGAKLHAALHSFVYYRANRILLGYYVLWGSNMIITRSSWRKVRHEVCRIHGVHEDMDLAAHLHASQIPIYYEKHLLASMELKRVASSPVHLWRYLMKWADSLRRHDRIAGILCYPLAALVFLFGVSIGRLITGTTRH